jgi:hypothetical protein
MMSAVNTVRSNVARGVSLGRNELAFALADRELGRLARMAEKAALDPRLVQHLAACVTLAQGLDKDTFYEFAVSEKAAIHRPSGGDPAALAECLHEALPRADGGIAAVLPDLIGEALVVRVLEPAAGASNGVIARCYRSFPQPVAAATIRVCQDLGAEHPLAVAWIKAMIAKLPMTWNGCKPWLIACRNRAWYLRRLQPKQHKSW